MSEWITHPGFSLPSTLGRGLSELGYQNPTPVQKDVFGPILDGRDIIVQSQTGSGKTTAFCLPLLAKLDSKSRLPQVLVLAPTRELAKQVATECGRLGHHHEIRVAAIYGGASMEAQVAALKSGVQVVVGTPGRVKDLLERRLFDPSGVKFAVLDEADEMLSMGFWEDVTDILGRMPQNRQTLLFSATMPPKIESQSQSLLKDPVHINKSVEQVGASTIRHIVHTENDAWPKVRNLLFALEFHHPIRAIVFCNRKEETDLVESYLRRFGYHTRALHGDLSQREREKVMGQFREGQLDILIATDIAARGIDISAVSHVFNYELPENDEVYVHRTGRTGRIGRLGTAVNLVRGKDITTMAGLNDKFGVSFEEIALPDEHEILWMQGERLGAQLLEEADGVEISQYRPVAESMMGRGDVKEIFAFLLRSHYAKMQEKRRPPQAEPENFREEEAQPQRPAAHERKQRPPRFEQKPEREREREREREPEAEPEAEAAAQEIFEQPSRPNDREVQLYVSLGQVDGMHDVVQLSAYLSNLSGVDLGYFTGAGQVREQSSHVWVDSEVADQVIAAVHGKPREHKIRGASETITCESATSKDKPFVARRPRPRHRR